MEMKSKNLGFIYTMSIFAAIGGLLFGYDTGVISSAILFIKQQFNLSDTMQEVVVSAILMGAIVGAIFGGIITDRLGRKKTIIIAATVFALGALLTALAPHINLIIFGRIIIGMAIGVSSFAVPLYISEIAPAKIRGKLVSFNQLAVTIGIMVAYFVGYFCSKLFLPTTSWRAMFIFAAIPAVILLVAMIKMPESPRWLISKNQIDKAKAILLNLYEQIDVDNKIKEIVASLKVDQGTWREVFSPLVRPALFVGVFLAISQQVTGINTIIYYAPTIFEFAGFKDASSAILATMVVGITNVLLTILALFLLDRAGRKKLLYVGLTGMAICLGVIGLAFNNKNIDQGIIGWISVVCLASYVGFFAISLGPIFWLMIAEIYPLRVRGKAMSLATCVNWASNLLISITFLTLIDYLGKSNTFWLYGILCVASIVFVYLYVPETKGKTLEDIEAYWLEKQNAEKIKSQS